MENINFKRNEWRRHWQEKEYKEKTLRSIESSLSCIGRYRENWKHNGWKLRFDDYRKNRKKRILKVLELAKVSPENYLLALQESYRKGIAVILQRDIDEIFSNIDIQPCFDFFAVVTYITEYFTKDESGTSSFLAEASKQIQPMPIKEQRRCITNVFLTQMGMSKAFMKIFPEIKLKDSNIGNKFVPLGRKKM